VLCGIFSVPLLLSLEGRSQDILVATKDEVRRNCA
jgi:hypothetical protein